MDANPGVDLTGMISEPGGIVNGNAGLVVDETGGELTAAELVGGLVKETVRLVQFYDLFEKCL